MDRGKRETNRKGVARASFLHLCHDDIKVPMPQRQRTVPALLKRQSMRPNRRNTSVTTRSQSDGTWGQPWSHGGWGQGGAQEGKEELGA